MTISKLALLIVLSAAPLASGVPITFYYSGQVTFLDDPHGLLDGSIVAGISFSGSYTFESSMTDEAPNDPSYGLYRLPAPPSSVMTTSVGNYTFVGPSYEVVVQNEPLKDFFMMRTDGFQSEGVHIGSMLVWMNDEDGTTFPGDALPLVPPPLDPFLHRRFELWGGTATTVTFRVFGSLSSLTPEPYLSGLFGLTGAGLIFTARSRRAQQAR